MGRIAGGPFQEEGKVALGSQLVAGEETRIALLAVQQVEDVQGQTHLYRVGQAGQQAGEEKAGYGRGLGPRREADEGGFGKLSRADFAHTGSSSRTSRSSNLAMRWRKRRWTVPVGPLRCLATMIWAMPAG